MMQERIPFIQPDLDTWLKSFNFYSDVKVRFSETDALGHLNNVSYFTYFEDGRLNYLEHLHLLDHLLHPKASTVLVTADLQCHYIKQVFFNERLKVGVKVARIGNSSLELQYCITVPKRHEVVAVGRGAIVNIVRETGKSTPFSEDIRTTIMEFEKLE